MVDKWCVIIMLVYCFCSVFNVFWIKCLDFVLRVDVVLLRISMGVLVSIVFVMVICWCWLLESIKLFLLIIVFNLLGKFDKNFLICVIFVVFLMFLCDMFWCVL